MAKTVISDGDSSPAASNAVELKRELLILVKAIVDENDVNLEAVDRAHQVLCALKGMKLKKSASRNSHSSDAATVPEEFKCPLSMELMRDPVIVATGQAYERVFIQNWLKAGNRVCPRTQRVLSHTVLTPNNLIREMIMQWCKNHGIRHPDCVHSEEGLTEADRDRFLSLLRNMSLTLPKQKEAAKELRHLTKRMPSFRALFGESLDAIPQLLSPLSQSESEGEVHPDLQVDLITTLLNLSIHDSNKKLVAETPMVIPILMAALRSGTIETRSNAAAAIFTLSALDSNKELIGNSGALRPLIDLLDEGHELEMKDAASAIFNLCIFHENKMRAVRDGLVPVILHKIESRIQVDELLSILAMLSTNQRAIEEMGELDAVPFLLSIIRETSCPHNKENCIVVLYAICSNDRSRWKQIREEESRHHTISQLAKTGTSRAQRKANGILERLNKTSNRTHTE